MGDHAQNGGQGLTPDPAGGAPADAAFDPASAGESALDETAALERGRILFAGPCTFLLSVSRLDQLPESRCPEIAFAGRSNVGKSSLVNALTGRRTLAKTSVTPGRTQQLNFFDLGGRLMLVDLPGYGYARAPKASVAAWSRAVELYLAGRQPLRRALLLIDARHGLKDVDRRIMELLDRTAVAYQFVLTKADKISAVVLAERIAAIEGEFRGHAAAHPEVVATSARTVVGIDRLRAALAMLATWRADQGG